MSFLDKITAFLPLGKKEEQSEYFFAINIGTEKITAALWAIEGKELKILSVVSQDYSSLDEIVSMTDQLLDQAVGLKEVEPQKILFGVPNSWLAQDDLKDDYLKILRGLVKELELSPMAYVATSQALVHFLEKQAGIPATAILVGLEELHLTVTVVRAGKLDGVKVVTRGEAAGSDIEKALLTFTDVETLPSKILIYGEEADELKRQLLSFSWMSKLSFLHFPKIEVLDEDTEIKSVCLAGGSEMNESIIFKDQPVKHTASTKVISDDEPAANKKIALEENSQKEADDLGFMVGDVVDQQALNITTPAEFALGIDGFEEKAASVVAPKEIKKRFNLKKFIPKRFATLSIMLGLVGAGVLLIGAFLFLLKADIKIYVEPKILEKDAQVVADPNQKTIDEASKIIPGQIVEVEVAGSAKDTASGKKQIGDPAKGTVVLYNKTADSQSLSKGTQVSGSGGFKFTLDTSVTIASQSASDSGITFGKANTTATATSIGADGNLPSGSDLTVAGYSADKLAAKAEGNFSGGTSKDVTVVSSDDQQRLLAKLSSDLKQQAQQKLQEQYHSKKILTEALSENIVKKSYSKNINDQASEFSLNMTTRYKGTAFDDADLRTIVAKLVNTQVPDGFQLNISDTETQADVSELKKDGKLVFLARFKAKLLPKINTDKIRSQIKFQTVDQVTEILKGTDNILGSEIKITPALLNVLQRLPLFNKNIMIEVGLK